jgi:hypothetical protein
MDWYNTCVGVHDLVEIIIVLDEVGKDIRDKFLVAKRHADLREGGGRGFQGRFPGRQRRPYL